MEDTIVEHFNAGKWMPLIVLFGIPLAFVLFYFINSYIFSK